MKALTLTEPWASLVAIGAKRVETRSWATSYRGPIAIHAAKGLTVDDVEFAFMLQQQGIALNVGHSHSPSYAFRQTKGCVIAVAELVHCVRIHETKGPTSQGLTEKWGCHPREMEFGDYTPGRFVWMLRNIVRLPDPIPARGMLGLWDWDPPAELAGAA